MRYLVKWEIDIEADTFDEAAEQALEIMHDKKSEATCFTVIRHYDKAEKDVDLLNQTKSNEL